MYIKQLLKQHAFSLYKTGTLASFQPKSKTKNIMEDLLTFLNSVYPLEKDSVEFLMENVKWIEIPQKKFLLKAGRICHNIYFIKKGILRCFHIKNDDEVSSAFMSERELILSVESFFNQKVSKESIQALEDCFLFYISFEELQFAYQHFPDFNSLGRILTEKYYQLSKQTLYSLRMQRAQEKYLFLLNHSPHIIQRVPLKYIASYLSITEETLSRVRSRKH